MDSLQEFMGKLSKMNKTVKVSDLMDIKRYYLGLYHRYVVEMYDKNYTGDPTFLDMREVYQVIDDLEIVGLMDSMGMLDLSFESIDFVREYYATKKPEEEEIIEYLNLLSKAIYYREISQNLDKLYDSGTTQAGGKKKIDMKCYFDDSCLKFSKPYRFDEGIKSCLLGIGVPVVAESLIPEILKLMEERLGIEDAEFIAGFDREQTARHLRLILEERVELDGKDGFSIHNINKNLREKGFIVDNYYKTFMENETDAIRGLFSSHIEKDKNILYMYGLDIYRKSDQKKSKITYPIGFYTFAQYDITTGVTLAHQWYHNHWSGIDDYEGLLPEKNSILGYTGQVYSKDYLEHNQLDYVGCPIKLFNHEGVLEEFIDFEQTELQENKTMFKEYEATLEFNGYQPKKPSKRYTAWGKKILQLYRAKETGEFETEIEISPNGFDLNEIPKLADKIELDLRLGEIKKDAD